MKAIILAGGMGKRLRPLTYACAKPLLPIAGVPTIDYVINNLIKEQEIDEIIIGINYKIEDFFDYFKNKDFGVKIKLVKTLGFETGGDLKTILVNEEIDEDVLICYADNITDISIYELISAHKILNSVATVALFEVDENEVSKFGIASISGSGAIQNFIEKPNIEDVKKPYLANTGYYILSKRALDMLSLKKGKTEEILFPKLIEQNLLIGHVISTKMWLDMGSMEKYLYVNKYYLDKYYDKKIQEETEE